MPPGSTLHLPVPAGAAGGGVPPGSTLHLPVPAGAAGGGVPPGSALHLPVLAGAAGGGVPLYTIQSLLVHPVVECLFSPSHQYRSISFSLNQWAHLKYIGATFICTNGQFCTW